MEGEDEDDGEDEDEDGDDDENLGVTSFVSDAGSHETRIGNILVAAGGCVGVTVQRGKIIYQLKGPDNKALLQLQQNHVHDMAPGDLRRIMRFLLIQRSEGLSQKDLVLQRNAFVDAFHGGTFEDMKNAVSMVIGAW